MKIYKNLNEMKNITRYYTLIDLMIMLGILSLSYLTSKNIHSYLKIPYFLIASILGIHLISYSSNNYYKRNFYDLLFLYKRLKNRKGSVHIDKKNKDFLILDSNYIFGLTTKDKNKLLDNIKEFYNTFKYPFKYITYNKKLNYDKHIQNLEKLKTEYNKEIINEKILELKELNNKYESTHLICYFYDSLDEKNSIESLIKEYLPILDITVDKTIEIKKILENLGIENVNK